MSHYDPADDLAAMAAAAAAQDDAATRAAENRIIHGCHRIIGYTLRRLRLTQEPDAESGAYEGILRAAREYIRRPPEVPFIPLAFHRCRRYAWAAYITRRRRQTTSIDALSETYDWEPAAPNAPPDDPRDLRQDLARKVAAAGLTPNQLRILKLRYFDNTHRTFDQVAAALHITRQAAQLAEASALQRIRRSLARHPSTPTSPHTTSTRTPAPVQTLPEGGDVSPPDDNRTGTAAAART